MKHAVIETGGKQYRVAEGDVIYVEKLNVADGETVTFDKVLAVVDEAESRFGAPTLDGATVSATVEKTGKGKKIRVYKMKPKKNYRRTLCDSHCRRVPADNGGCGAQLRASLLAGCAGHSRPGEYGGKACFRSGLSGAVRGHDALLPPHLPAAV